jgi:glutathione S-transferase
MTYELAIADKIYSSWSLRGWLLFEKFNIPFRQYTARMYQPEFTEMLAGFAPARLVPAMKYDGVVVHDTLAMAETLAERHPDKGMWPTDPAARAIARSVTAEMHSSFTALRANCTMNLRRNYPDYIAPKDVIADVERMTELWSHCRAHYGDSGPWLFGTYSIADAFFAPAASRFATYNLPQTNTAAQYVTAHLADPTFRRWRAMGFAQNYIQPGYDKDLPEGPWPGPTPLPAKPVGTGPSENQSCPYSGDPVTHFLELDTRTFGFCNAFCRDKTVADAQAWPPS